MGGLQGVPTARFPEIASLLAFAGEDRAQGIPYSKVDGSPDTSLNEIQHSYHCINNLHTIPSSWARWNLGCNKAPPDRRVTEPVQSLGPAKFRNLRRSACRRRILEGHRNCTERGSDSKPRLSRRDPCWCLKESQCFLGQRFDSQPQKVSQNLMKQNLARMWRVQRSAKRGCWSNAP